MKLKKINKNMITLHIFNYGEDQVVDGSLNKKFNNTELLNHQPVIDYLAIVNYRYITYTDKVVISYEDGTIEYIEPDDNLIELLNNLINEIIEK